MPGHPLINSITRLRRGLALGVYGDFVMMLDHSFGAVVKAPHDSGLENDTMVVFTSDNGALRNPAERANLYREHPERVAALEPSMKRIVLSKESRAD